MRPVMVLVAVVLLVSTGASAQQHPDLSGTWSTQPEPVPTGRGAGAARGSMGSGWGDRFTVRQEPNRFAVEYVFFSAYDLQPPISQVFSLDGSETRNDVMIGHETTERSSRAAWRADTLVLTTVSSSSDPAGSTTLRHALVLAAPDSLLVETTRSGPVGPPNVTRIVYTKGQRIP